MISPLQITKDATAQRLLDKIPYLKVPPSSCLDYMAAQTNTTKLLQKALPSAVVTAQNDGLWPGSSTLYDMVYSHWLFPNELAKQHIEYIKTQLTVSAPWLFTALGNETANQYTTKLKQTFKDDYQNPWEDITRLGDDIVQAGFTGTVCESQIIMLNQQKKTDHLEMVFALHECCGSSWNPQGQISKTDFITALAATEQENLCTLDLIVGLAFAPRLERSYQGIDGEITITPSQIKRS